MWMLYGGIDGDGGMINFDRKTLSSAMAADECECGHFDEEKGFRAVATLGASEIDPRLVDVLHFGDTGAEGRRTLERVGDARKATISADAFDGVSQIAKHEAWSYESEVRLVARVSKLSLPVGGHEVTAIKMPFRQSDRLMKERVFDSPVAPSGGEYRDSALRGTVDWNLCSGCRRAGRA